MEEVNKAKRVIKMWMYFTITFCLVCCLVACAKKDEPSTGGNVTIEDTKDMKETSLSLLEIEGYDIDFESDQRIYNIILDTPEQSLNINAQTSSTNATFKIEGNESFKEGNNVVKIIVTSKNGTVGEYYINVAQLPIEQLNSQIEIKTLGTTKKENYVISYNPTTTVDGQEVNIIEPDSIIKRTVQIYSKVRLIKELDYSVNNNFGIIVGELNNALQDNDYIDNLVELTFKTSIRTKDAMYVSSNTWNVER